MSGHLQATCPDCGTRLVWRHDDDPPDELTDRIRALEAERRRPTPPAPTYPRQRRGTP